MLIQKVSIQKTPTQVLAVRVAWFKWLEGAAFSGTPTVTVESGSTLTVTGVNVDTNDAAMPVTFLLGGGTVNKSELVTVTATKPGGAVEPFFIHVATMKP